MATFTAVLVVPDELDQDYLIEQLERLGVVAFCGPGSLVKSIDPDGSGAEERADVPSDR
jgi:predicted ABC-class ATPase